MQNATALSITNPLVLYRSLLATNKIKPDPAQLRLALHLQNLYERLKDYEPKVSYNARLAQLSKAIGPSSHANDIPSRPGPGPRPGIWQQLVREREKRDSLALTRVLTDAEEAMKLESPQGLMVHGEVGTGKSMLVDLFADCLPNKKKRRFHFNTFMLDTIAKLEKLRIQRVSRVGNAQGAEDHSLLWLARDLVEKSPILFLDEFQLPDRAAAKIMSSLMTGFFGLGGVLVATSNRMPDELAKAAGIEIGTPAIKTDEGFKWRGKQQRDSSKMFASHLEFAQFLDLLKARCEVWEMEGKSDYRRASEGVKALKSEDVTLSAAALGNGAPVSGLGVSTEEQGKDEAAEEGLSLPPKYHVQPQLSAGVLSTELEHDILDSLGGGHASLPAVPWTPASIKVYGRNVLIPRSHNGTAYFTFTEICGQALGPADYITLASSYHTFIILDVPILVSSLKEEARRLITLLDALYEARCKLFISAQVGPDDLFFPDLRPGAGASTEAGEEGGDAVYPETFAEIHQDLSEPFRPNISSYNASSQVDSNFGPSVARFANQKVLAEDALEDDPPNRMRRLVGKTDADFMETEILQVQRSPNFARTGLFTGEDEKFAYKRAASRLWEMCGLQWWARSEEGWWRPLPLEARGWERPMQHISEEMPAELAAIARGAAGLGDSEGVGDVRDVSEKEDQILFKHGASPFRTSREPPPKLGWQHAWGMVKWGKKAGAWGQGVEGLKDRQKQKDE